MIERESADKIPYLVKGQRDLSEFMARELLYDYATQQLDPSRELAVQKAIKENPILAKELDDILYGKTYCFHLSNSKVKEDVIKKVTYIPKIKEILKKYLNARHWNVNVIWTVEAILIVSFFTGIMYFAPWGSIINFINKKTKQGFELTIAKEQSSKDSVNKIINSRTIASTSEAELMFDYLMVLKVSNPKYTIDKMNVLLSKVGASLFEHKNELPNVLYITVPNKNKSKFIEELKAQGSLRYQEKEPQVADSIQKEIWNYKITIE